MKPGYNHCPHHTFTDMVKALVAGRDSLTRTDTGQSVVINPKSLGLEPKPEREDILLYIDRIRNHFTDSWKANYRQLWGEIIDHPTIASVIYDKGRQEDTTFNRNLVGHIINYLGQHGMIKKWNASKITQDLENTTEHSIRAALGKEPPENIIEVLKSYTTKDPKKK